MDQPIVSDARLMTGEQTKHRLLVSRIMGLIQGLDPGSAIPSERELASVHGVSRMTLRSAIDELVQEGYLVRRQGSGTYVTRPKIAKQMHLTSFTDDMRSRGLAASTRVIRMRRHPAGARIGARLALSPADQVVTAARLRLADDEPMAMEWLSVPDGLVPGLVQADLADSFYRLLRSRYGIRLEGGHQTVEATVTDEEESALLSVPIHSPALSVERTTWTADGQRVEFVRSLYRGDRYAFGMDLVQPRLKVDGSGG